MAEIRVKRANAILRVPEDQADRYLADGYDVIDEDGNILKESIPNDINGLKIAYDRHVKEIAGLKAELAKLKKRKAE